MRKIILTLWLLIFATSVLVAEADLNQKINDQLQQQLHDAKTNEWIRINIILENQYDSSALIEQSRALPKVERRDFVIDKLSKFSGNSQADLLSKLNNYKNTSSVKNIRALWVTNLINCYAKKDVISEISKQPEVNYIDHDEKRKLIRLEPTSQDKLQTNNSKGKSLAWNVTHVGANDAWDLGYTGAGVTVSVIDTGVNYNHTDLADHLWCSPSYPNHGYDYANNDDNPMDDHGHGTHVAGTVAGDGTSGTSTGMAPDAEIMCMKVMDSNGSGYESDVFSAIQFSITNGADVISMSLGWLHDWGPNRSQWRSTMDNVLAAGMIASVAAGNEGNQQYLYPVPDNIRTPGDCPPPWLHPDQQLSGGTSSVVAVGATNSSDNLANFSAHGPVTWEYINPFNDYPYSPEMGLIRPDVVAPGVSITSLCHYNNTGYVGGYNWSGTSMATPCVSGIMALMLSKNDGICAAEIDQILEENAYHITTNKSNTYGSGRVKALESVNAVPSPSPVFFVNPTQIDFGEVIVGEDSVAQFTLQNQGGGNLSGSITTPLDFSVCEANKNQPKNSIDYSLTGGESQVYNLTFTPTQEVTYEDSVQITQVPFFNHFLGVTGVGTTIASVDENDVNFADIKFDVFPNPVTTISTVEFYLPGNDSNEGILEIYNTKGQIVRSVSISEGKTDIPLNNLTSGLYFYKLNLNEKYCTKKVILLEN